MILKGSQRGHASDLATHLCNEFENEHIEIAELRGTVAGDLHGAFTEIEATARGTKATQPFFSLALNPSAPLTRDQYAHAIDQIEARLGLSGQPRAVIFHEKIGADGMVREHAHIVWSRIKTGEMRALPMSHFKTKLCDVACQLAHEFGHELPDGLKAWEARQKHKKDKLDLSYHEASHERQTGKTAEDRRSEITACYESADNAAALRAALEDKGYVLAQGDRRAYVLVDETGTVLSLARYVKGVRTKDINRRLEALPPEALPTVEQAKAIAARRNQARDELKREQEGQQERHEQREQHGQDDAFKQYEQAQRAKLKALHDRRRAALAETDLALRNRQADERLLIAAAHTEQQTSKGFRVRAVIADLIERTPGLRSVLGPLQKLTGLDPRARQDREHKALADRHKRERAEIKRKERALEKIEAREERSLQRRLERRKRLGEAEGLTGLVQGQVRQTDPHLLESDALARRFHDAAHDHDGHHAGAGGGDADDDGYSWKSRAADYRRKQGKGRGIHRRHDDGDEDHHGGDDGPDGDPF
jgi:hypothetical protein